MVFSVSKVDFRMVGYGQAGFQDGRLWLGGPEANAGIESDFGQKILKTKHDWHGTEQQRTETNGVI